MRLALGSYSFWRVSRRDRLVNELVLAAVTTVEAANRFIRDVYVPAHNARFAVTAEQEGSAFVAIPGVDLTQILCEQEECQVGKDNTVAFNRMRLQIPPSPLRAHFVHARVNVHQYPGGYLAILRDRRCLGRYDSEGVLQDATLGTAA